MISHLAPGGMGGAGGRLDAQMPVELQLTAASVRSMPESRPGVLRNRNAVG